MVAVSFQEADDDEYGVFPRPEVGHVNRQDANVYVLVNYTSAVETHLSEKGVEIVDERNGMGFGRALVGESGRLYVYRRDLLALGAIEEQKSLSIGRASTPQSMILSF